MTLQDPPQPSSYGLELRERLVVIETKLDQYNETRTTAFTALAIAQRNERDIAELKTYATQNRDTSVAAKSSSAANAEDINELKDSLKWSHRSAAVIVAGVLLNLIINVLQSP